MDYKLKDYYFERAKQEGYKSRAAYKLLEIDKKYKLLKRGLRVIDLGSAPGSWLQIALEAVGESGYIWGIDKAQFEFPQKDNLVIINKDIEDEQEREEIFKLINKKIDIVLSDMAPKLSGIRDTDSAKIFSLAEAGLEIAVKTLRKDGTFLCKVFHDEMLKDFKTLVLKSFKTAKLIVPKAKRRSSSETYMLAKGFKG